MDDDAMDDSHEDMAEMDTSDSDDMDNETMSDTMDEADSSNDMAGDDESMEEASTAMTDLPLWQTLPMTNVATGESFTLADFQGKTVFVEPMATWCSNCRMQQGNIIPARLQLGDDVVFIGLSLETNLPDEDLARYARDNGFNWTYAVMSAELLSELADEFGRVITSAPSTPHFIIRADGSFTELSTGIDSPAEIVAKIQEAQS
jgi:thiol-disulfide isomerase/thioredoxin